MILDVAQNQILALFSLKTRSNPGESNFLPRTLYVECGPGVYVSFAIHIFEGKKEKKKKYWV